MRYLPTTITRLVLPLTILTGAFYQCIPGVLFEATPKLGDSRQGQTDGMTLIFVPPGEFSKGIDYIGLRYALQICKQAGLGLAAFKGSSYKEIS